MNVSTKALRAVACAASKDTGRYAIAGVHLSAGKVEATDGRMLLRADAEMDAGEQFTPCVATTDTVKAACATVIAKRGGVVPFASNGHLSFRNDVGEVPAAKVDAEFPDTRGVVPDKDKCAFSVTIAAHLLAALAKAANEANAKGDVQSVTFGFQAKADGSLDVTAPIRVDLEGGVTGCVMAMAL